MCDDPGLQSIDSTPRSYVWRSRPSNSVQVRRTGRSVTDDDRHGREARCAFCSATFTICDPCNRGHSYCPKGPCRHEGKLLISREATRRYRASDEGRQDHRDRERTYRPIRRARREERAARMAHVGSQIVAISMTVSSRADGRTSEVDVEPVSVPREHDEDERDGPDAVVRAATGCCVVCNRPVRWFRSVTRGRLGRRDDQVAPRVGSRPVAQRASPCDAPGPSG